MTSWRRMLALMLAAAVSLARFSAWAHEDDEAFDKEISVGRTAAGKIKAILHFAQPIALPKSVFPGISGHVTATLSFHSAVFDEATNDFFQLASETNFRFVLLAKDPGMEVWDDTASDFMNIGDSFRIGLAPFDSHPLWNLVYSTPGNPSSLTLKLIEMNGFYTESDPFTIHFSPPRPYMVRIAPNGMQNLAVSWPTNAVGWQLQAANSLTAPNWSAVTNVPTVAGTNYLVNIPAAAEAQQFFRLHHED